MWLTGVLEWVRAYGGEGRGRSTMQGEKAKRGRPRKNRPYVPNSCGTNTLTMGPRLRFREHMTKGEFVQACFETVFARFVL